LSRLLSRRARLDGERVQLAAGDLLPDRLHDETLALDERQSFEGVTDDDGLEMLAIPRDLDLGSG
jgi:hypothetical protein